MDLELSIGTPAALLSCLALLAATATGCASEVDPDDGLEEQGESESALSPNVKIETTFADQDGKPEAKRAILRNIARMIEKAPEGSAIDVALHSIDDDAVMGALIDANKPARKVTLRVVQNGAARDSGNAKKLAEALGKKHRFCGTKANGGCLTNVSGSIMHSKLFLFSKTEDASGKPASNVSWFSSANMTEKTGVNTWNNAVTVLEDDKLYREFEKEYFEKLWNETYDGKDFFDPAKPRGYFGSPASGTLVYASPSTDDLVAGRLRQVETSNGCEIMVSQNMIHDERPQVLAQLARLAKPSDPKHCNVRVLVNHVDAALGQLKAAAIKVKYSHTHDKLVLVNAKVSCGNACATAPKRKIVLTGSHNWTGDANYANDEILVRMENPQVYGPMLDYWERQWKNGEDR